MDLNAGLLNSLGAGPQSQFNSFIKYPEVGSVEDRLDIDSIATQCLAKRSTSPRRIHCFN